MAHAHRGSACERNGFDERVKLSSSRKGRPTKRAGEEIETRRKKKRMTEDETTTVYTFRL